MPENKSLSQDAAADPEDYYDTKHGDPGREVNEFDYTPKQERRIITRIDLRLLISLGALYSFSLVDRANLSNASVAGMKKDLNFGTSASRYSIVSMIFYAPYVLVQLPANILVRKINPRFVLGTLGIVWGIAVLCMGFVHDWLGIMGLRIVLGALEGGFFPASTFLIQCWYTRKEVQKRLAFFYMISVCISGFSNILAWGASTLDGAHGLEGWRWIFIVEGTITIGLGIYCVIAIVGFPDKKVPFLNEHERAFVNYRVEKDRGDSIADELNFKVFIKHLLDYKLWIYSLMYMSSTAPAIANGYFLVLVLQGSLGYSVRDSMLLVAPPFLAAVVVCLTLSWISDKLWLRGPFIVLQAIFVIIGISLTAYSTNGPVRYLGAYFNVIGAQGNVPAILAYNANNICTYSKRSVSTALVIGFGGIGGVYASATYRDKDAPTYIPGAWATIASQLLIIAGVCVLSLVYYIQNRKQANGTLKTPLENTPGFRYTY